MKMLFHMRFMATERLGGWGGGRYNIWMIRHL